MTIKEFAKAQGISTQAVYQRLRKQADKEKKQLSDYVSRDTSEITEEGYKVLQSLYKQPVSKERNSQTNLQGKIDALQTEVDSQKELIKSLQSRLTDKEKEFDNLQSTIADLRKDKEFLQTLLNSLTQQPKQGIIRRLFGGKQKATAQTPTATQTPSESPDKGKK